MAKTTIDLNGLMIMSGIALLTILVVSALAGTWEQIGEIITNAIFFWLGATAMHALIE